MTSAYAQSGKLFEEMRSSNVINFSTRRENRIGAMALANRKRTQLNFSRKRDQPAPASGYRDVGERNEASWLNRVTPLAQPTPSVTSRTIECMEDIQMSQMTDDFSSQYSDQHIDTTESRKTTADLKHQPDSLERFRHGATPRRTHGASRFHLLSVPSQRIADALSTPRANASVASSRTPYQPRCGNKSKPWTERFNPCTPFRNNPCLAQRRGPQSIDSSTKPALHAAYPVRFATDESQLVPGSTVSLTASNEVAAPRRCTMLETTSAEKLVNDQLKKVDEKVAVLEALIASGMSKIAEGTKSSLSEIDEGTKSSLSEIDEGRKSSLSEINIVTRTATSGLNETRNYEIRQIEVEALELRKQNEHAATGFFQKQRTLFIDTCMPFLQQKATSMIANILQGPSFLGIFDKKSTTDIDINKNSIAQTHSSSVKASFTPNRRSKSAVLVGVSSTKPSRSKSEHREHVVDSQTPRRSKREASKRNPFCPAATVREAVASISTRGRKAKSMISEKVMEETKSTISMSETGVDPSEGHDEQKEDSQMPSEQTMNPAHTLCSPPRKRKKIFGGPGASLHGANVSPEQSLVSTRKKARIEEDIASIKNRNAVESHNHVNPTTPKIALFRRKADFKPRHQVHKRGPALIEDTFDFNF